MNLDTIREATRRQMPDLRWRHTLGVVDSAIELAKKYGGDAGKAELAALLHDYAKAWPIERQAQVIRDQGMPLELLDHDKELWHAPVGAWAVQDELGIEDEEVLDAIRYHTSGRERMTVLDRIVCLADYIEPGREYPGVERVRRLAGQNMTEALIAGFDTTLAYLLEKGKRIFPLTVVARNGLIEERNTHRTGG